MPVLVARGIESVVELSWTELSAAVRYELIFWLQGATGWQPLGGDNLTATTYRHADLVAGVTYHYHVRIIDAAGEKGPWSKIVSATVLAPQSPTVTATPTAATPTAPQHRSNADRSNAYCDLDRNTDHDRDANTNCSSSRAFRARPDGHRHRGRSASALGPGPWRSTLSADVPLG